TPWVKGDPRARAASLKGAETRRAKAAARKGTVRAMAEELTAISATFDRDRLGTHAAACASWLMGRVVSGQIPVRNGDEAATLLRALVDVARIEAGQPTGTTVVAHLGSSAMAEVLALRDQARAALGMGNAVDIDSATTSTTS
ncbi:MAG TPA: hypothetical protein VKE25_07230, partial [Actinomycetes bacterium]|nr:hypothetical protein [Actinomycetes bacterium]